MKQKTVEMMRNSLEALCECISTPAAAVLPGARVLAVNRAYRSRFSDQDGEIGRALDRSEGVREASRTGRPQVGTSPFRTLATIGPHRKVHPAPERSGSVIAILVVFDDEDAGEARMALMPHAARAPVNWKNTSGTWRPGAGCR